VCVFVCVWQRCVAFGKRSGEVLSLGGGAHGTKLRLRVGAESRGARTLPRRAHCTEAGEFSAPAGCASALVRGPAAPSRRQRGPVHGAPRRRRLCVCVCPAPIVPRSPDPEPDRRAP
jgi:hypothetical protein